MDVAQKKQEILERIAESPASIVFARIDVLNEVQLADLMKADFVPFLRGAANTAHSNTDSLHEVCTNLAKQRALLQGAAVGDILSFVIDFVCNQVCNCVKYLYSISNSYWSNSRRTTNTIFRANRIEI